MRLMRPLAMADETTTPCAREGTLYSAAYFAAPVTFARPSMREVGLPRGLVTVMALPLLPDPLVRLRLRSPARRLRQRAHDAAPRQLDLEVVVAESARTPQHGLGRAREALPRRCRAVELRFGFTVAPRLVRHSAECEARLLDRAALDIETDRDRHQSERIGQPIADLQIRVVARKAFRRQLDRGDDLVRPQIVVDVRGIARQAMEVGKRDAALAAGAGDQDARLERRERDAHVRREHGDATLARAQDRVAAVDALDRRAAAAGLAFVAWRGRVVEIEATRPLQKVAPGRGHVAQLRRGAGEDRAAQHGIARLDLRVIGEIAVGNQRADPQAAIGRRLDLAQRQMRDVDQPRWPRDVLLHQIDQIGAARDEFRGRVCRDPAYGVGDVAGARIFEIIHRPPSPAFSVALPDMTSSIAATMFG